ncbi:hypothetical protein [Actinocorallia populi]|uniref:hypothetical protein n=1 Tax=Actinocorallia populi TaxID=2079200 RepID=UPI000D09178D|nr:hypothetical protein [Actinocorallia populi]
MQPVLLACAAHLIYLTGFVIFKTTGASLPPLSPRRPFHATVKLVSSAPWLVGLATVMSGTVVAAAAVNTAPVSIMLATYLFGLLLLLAVGLSGFKERLNRREGSALGLLAAALVLVAVPIVYGYGAFPSRSGAGLPDPSPWMFAAATVPSLLFPIWLFCVRERKVEGRHARRLTGVAYGIGAGVLLGTAETMGVAMIPYVTEAPRELLYTPYPVVFLLAGALGLGLLHIGLQERRLILVCAVMNIVGKIQLVCGAALLFGEPWPSEPLWLALELTGVFLALYAVLLFPRYERVGRPVAAVPPAPKAAPARVQLSPDRPMPPQPPRLPHVQAPPRAHL